MHHHNLTLRIELEPFLLINLKHFFNWIRRKNRINWIWFGRKEPKIWNRNEIPKWKSITLEKCLSVWTILGSKIECLYCWMKYFVRLSFHNISDLMLLRIWEQSEPHSEAFSYVRPDFESPMMSRKLLLTRCDKREFVFYIKRCIKIDIKLFKNWKLTFYNPPNASITNPKICSLKQFIKQYWEPNINFKVLCNCICIKRKTSCHYSEQNTDSYFTNIFRAIWRFASKSWMFHMFLLGYPEICL